MIYARVVYRDETGRRVERHYKAESKTHARELYRKKLQELTQHGSELIQADRMTFRDLAGKFQADRLQPPVYAGDMRISGMASYKRQEWFLKALLEYFGHRRVKSITVHDLEKYRSIRFATPTQLKRNADGEPVGKQSVAHVNRELSLLRAIFNYAKRAGWIARTPFEAGKGLISLADENRRDRLLSRVEEAALLGQCVERRAHLRPLIIAALDTAMRKGELLKLTPRHGFPMAGDEPVRVEVLVWRVW